PYNGTVITEQAAMAGFPGGRIWDTNLFDCFASCPIFGDLLLSECGVSWTVEAHSVPNLTKAEDIQVSYPLITRNRAMYPGYPAPIQTQPQSTRGQSFGYYPPPHPHDCPKHPIVYSQPPQVSFCPCCYLGYLSNKMDESCILPCVMPPNIALAALRIKLRNRYRIE
ncbi:hypothetical protein LSH36_135g05033, partial [Paralvinella palmiformis]